MGLGATQGFHGLAELKHVWAYDLDRDAVDTYNRNLCEGNEVAVVGNVKQVLVEELKAVDIFAFGFPCNDFSVVGEQLGIKGDYGPLYSYGIKVLRKKQPIAFVAENVGGLTSANEGKTFQTILREMRDAGYIVVPHLYNAEQYGVAQSRKRIIIVGIRDDLELTFEPPAPSTIQARTVHDELVLNPVPDNAANHEPTRQSAIVQKRLSYIKAGENAFNANLPEDLKLNVSGAKISQIYKRLDPTKPSYTITGSGGGGTHVYHWKENRALTNRERARLQSFPDWFIFEGSKESVRKQIGMAVPPRLASAVFQALIRTLVGIEYDSIKPNISFDGLRIAKRDQQNSFVFESVPSYT